MTGGRAILLLALAASVAGCGGGERGAAPPTSTDARNGGIARAVDAPACSDIRYRGRGRPDVVIASSFPFQGVLGAEARQASQAVDLAIARRGYRAGRWSVGYQPCDDSTVQAAASTPERCAANGRAFAAARQVIGVIGSLYSSCMAILLPALNQATGGALAVLSPANTYTGLTHAGPGTAPGEPRRYYPSGRRNFVRLAVADDAQGAGNALFAERLGLRRVYAVHDGTAYGSGIATVFAAAARASGLSVVGVRPWKPRARRYTTLARTIRHARVDGVFVGGQLVNNGGRLVADLRAVLGSRVRLLGSDGMGPPSALMQRAGRAAEGVTLTKPDIPRRFLNEPGRRFHDAVRERTGKDPCCYTMHAGQAADVLLDAIAASDGTRRSVTARVLRTRVRDGVLGDFAFDRNGDITLRRIFVHQIRRGELTFVMAITPGADLLPG
jgi:branched-chain amino acid transport system substrate-binding protein